MKIWGKEIWKFPFLCKWQDEAMISWLYFGFSILMIGTHFYPKNINIIHPCGSKHTFIVVQWSLLLMQNKQKIYIQCILHNYTKSLYVNTHLYFFTVNYPFLNQRGKATVSIYLAEVSKQLKILCLYYKIISINVLIYLDFSDKQRISPLHPNQNFEKIITN